ncbi:hypothetical protein GCM10023310_70690 [Paenibacillus vulneris]
MSMDKYFRWIVIYKDNSKRFSNLHTENDVWLWEKKIGNLDKLSEIIPNPNYVSPFDHQ